MSLIKCPACEKEISSNAVSCPHCGEPLKPQKTRTLTLTREFKRFIGSGAIIQAYLDGLCIGSIENGGTFQCEISTEAHTLYPVNLLSATGASGETEKPKTVQIPAGEDPVSYKFCSTFGIIAPTIFFEKV